MTEIDKDLDVAIGHYAELLLRTCMHNVQRTSHPMRRR